jgi:hypothetical protein
VVAVALAFQPRAIQILFKLLQYGLREYGLVVADSQKNLQGLEWLQLMVDEIGPGFRQIGNDVEVGSRGAMSSSKS